MADCCFKRIALPHVLQSPSAVRLPCALQVAQHSPGSAVSSPHSRLLRFHTYVSMAHRETAPYAPQDHNEVRQLIQSLEGHKGKTSKSKGFSVRKHTFPLSNGRSVDSWKMNDWDYKKEHLPTYARGLFTYKTLDGKDEIVVRGYDKFFNHGEVRKTEWMNVERNTRGPYELSVKENGCIIFISGLDDGTLLVCSKHSTGARGDGWHRAHRRGRWRSRCASFR